MKKALSLILCAAMPLLLTVGNAAEEKHVAKTTMVQKLPEGSPEIARLYAQVVSQVINDRQLGVTISQHLEGGLHLGDRGDRMVAVDFPGSEVFPEGKVIYGHLKAAGTYSYTSVLGAKITVERFTFSPTSLKMTPEGFIARLKTGESFKIYDGGEIIRCPDCMGWGRVTDKSGSRREKDGKKDCPSCTDGKASVPVIRTIKW